MWGPDVGSNPSSGSASVWLVWEEGPQAQRDEVCMQVGVVGPKLWGPPRHGGREWLLLSQAPGPPRLMGHPFLPMGQLQV